MIEEEKKALAPGGFKLGTSRSPDHWFYPFATATALDNTDNVAFQTRGQVHGGGHQHFGGQLSEGIRSQR